MYFIWSRFLASFSLLQICIAQDPPLPPRWVIHPSCRDGEGGLKIRTAILNGMKDAINLARTASELMEVTNDNPPKPKPDATVDAMCKLVLGTTNYEANYIKVKGIFDAVASMPETPYSGDIKGFGWAGLLMSRNIEFHCDLSRLDSPNALGNVRDNSRPMGNGKGAWLAKIQYDLIKNSQDINFQRAKGVPSARGITTHAAQNGVVMDDWVNVIHISKWLIRSEEQRGKPDLESNARLEWTQTADMQQSLTKNPAVAQIDALKTIGSTILHELTHTVPGGLLKDVTEKDAQGVDLKDENGQKVRKCYGWFNVVRLQDVTNSDSLAMLAIALKMRKTGSYRVEKDGKIKGPNDKRRALIL